MDWLIKLVIEAIGIPPVYIHRGDPHSYDFDTGDFVKDGTFNDLDLSAIVPAGASAVAFHFGVAGQQVNAHVLFETTGDHLSKNFAEIFTPVANNTVSGDFIVALDADRKITYQFSNVVWLFCKFTVKGWWL